MATTSMNPSYPGMQAQLFTSGVNMPLPKGQKYIKPRAAFTAALMYLSVMTLALPKLSFLLLPAAAAL